MVDAAKGSHLVFYVDEQNVKYVSASLNQEKTILGLFKYNKSNLLK